MIEINDTISYIEATDAPLSADVGVIRNGGAVWLYDVGNGEKALSALPGGAYRVVLSHFHADHTGNLDRIPAAALYVSQETYRHVGRGIVVSEALCVGDLRIFPLPSSHAKGCLGLEVGGTYAFVGDGLYSKVRDGCYIYNTQFLRDEIAVLRALWAPNLLVSHRKGLVQARAEALEALEAIYAMREKNFAEIKVPIHGL